MSADLREVYKRLAEKWRWENIDLIWPEEVERVKDLPQFHFGVSYFGGLNVDVEIEIGN